MVLNKSNAIETEKPDPIIGMKTFVSFLSFLALLFGAVSQWTYYSCFGINIFEYSSFSELLAAALLWFVVLMIFIPANVLIYFLTMKAIFFVLFKGNSFPIKMFDTNTKHNYLIGVMEKAVNAPMLVYEWYCVFTWSWNRYFVAALVIFAALVLLLHLLIRKFDAWYALFFCNRPGKTLRFYAAGLLIVLNYGICTGLFRAGKAKNRPGTGVAIRIGANTITSSTQCSFLGRTADFSFFYEITNDRVDIYPNKNIDQIIYK